MRRLFLFFSVLIGLATPSVLFAMEAIPNFQVTLSLEASRRVHVTEQITYDFGTEARHGLFRTIPVVYERLGASYRLRLQNIVIQMDGQAVPWARSETGGSTKFKIGDPETWVHGTHVYTISYDTDRAVTFFDDHDEVYWNVTGNEWGVPLLSAQAEITVPDAALESILQTVCYTGIRGSDASDCEVTSANGRTKVTLRRALSPYEGLTVAVKLPKGLVKPPTTFEWFLMFVSDNWIFGLPLLVVMIGYGIWRAFGRDPALGTVVPMYEPPSGLQPGMVAAICEDGAFSARAMVATIIDLARRGYAHIRYEDASDRDTASPPIRFVPLKKDTTSLSSFEVALLREAPQDVPGEAWKRLQSLNIFVSHPSLVRGSALTAVMSITMFALLFAPLLPLHALVVIVSGAIAAVFAWFMPKRTTTGVEMYRQIKGLEWYLRVAEKDRLDFHNAPAKTPKQFEALLPFAIALGVETEWAKQFESVPMTRPEWIEGGGNEAWGTGMGYLHAISALRSSFAASHGSSSSTSGGHGGSGFSGGFSGGGVGGGGGGSW